MRGVAAALPLSSDGFAELVSRFSLPDRVAVGVSGGGDSTALLLLAAGWARSSGREIAALTVDHGIRVESRTETERVADLCRRLGVAHQTLAVEANAPSTGIQEWARAQRLELLSRWSRAQGEVPVLLAHTLEDQAETVLMRLLRGSGVDGLAGMREDSRHGDLRLVRPLLSVPGERLRLTLREHGQDWIEDPSNADERFERVRLRNLARELELDSAALARTAESMERARLALEAEAGRILHGSATWGALGELLIDLQQLAAVEEEYAARVVARAIRAVCGCSWRGIGRAGLDEVTRWAMAPGVSPRGRTLSGCVFRKTSRHRLLVVREPAMCDPPMQLAGGQQAVWDLRWRVWFDGEGSVEVGALGRDGAREIGRGPASWNGCPALARASAPAFRRDGRILAVPPARYSLWSGAAVAGAEIVPTVL